MHALKRIDSDSAVLRVTDTIDTCLGGFVRVAQFVPLFGSAGFTIDLGAYAVLSSGLTGREHHRTVEKGVFPGVYLSVRQFARRVSEPRITELFRIHASDPIAPVAVIQAG